MKLVVGLGNPLEQYKNTRHNVGFMVLDEVANILNKNFDKEKFQGLYFCTNIKNEKVMFLKPQKFMNLSGEVVKKIVDFYKISINDIYIISDDLDLPVGKIRLKKKGSSGGHNGLKNIFSLLNTTEIKRIKIGISNNKLCDTKNYVLGKFGKEEIISINEAIKTVSEIILHLPDTDFDKLMSKYN